MLSDQRYDVLPDLRATDQHDVGRTILQVVDDGLDARLEDLDPLIPQAPSADRRHRSLERMEGELPPLGAQDHEQPPEAQGSGIARRLRNRHIADEQRSAHTERIPSMASTFASESGARSISKQGRSRIREARTANPSASPGS